MNQVLLKHLLECDESEFPIKVKLKLVQPNIICDGRTRVSATYKAVVVRREKALWGKSVLCIKFKYKGEEIFDYMHENGTFVLPYLRDIVLK